MDYESVISHGQVGGASVAVVMADDGADTTTFVRPADSGNTWVALCNFDPKVVEEVTPEEVAFLNTLFK